MSQSIINKTTTFPLDRMMMTFFQMITKPFPTPVLVFQRKTQLKIYQTLKAPLRSTTNGILPPLLALLKMIIQTSKISNTK